MHTLVLMFLAISEPLFAAEADRLIGVWKLASWQVIVENGPPQNEFGFHPKVFLVLTREGRSVVVTTADHRRGGMSDSERAALHKSMLAYSGKYRVEGGDLIIRVLLVGYPETNFGLKLTLKGRAPRTRDRALTARK